MYLSALSPALKIRIQCALWLGSMLVALLLPQSVEATNFTNVSMRHSRMTVGLGIGATDPILVIMRPATTATEASVGIAFGSDFTVNATPSNITVTTTGLPSTYQGQSITAHPGIATATNVSGKNVTFPSNDLTVGTTYGFYITNGITNPASTGSELSWISTHSDGTPDFANYTDAIDASRIASYFVSDNGGSTDSDQITVTARIEPIYTLSLNAQSITLDTSLASVEYPLGPQNGSVNPVTATVTTNANNGHVMWLRANSSSGLTSTISGTSIPFAGTAADATPSSLSAGTEGVVIDINSTTNGSGSLSISDEFNGTTTSAGGTPSTTFQEIASANGPVGGLGDVVSIIPRVAISTTTQSADDFTNTLTIIGAGSF